MPVFVTTVSAPRDANSNFAQSLVGRRQVQRVETVAELARIVGSTCWRDCDISWQYSASERLPLCDMVAPRASFGTPPFSPPYAQPSPCRVDECQAFCDQRRRHGTSA